MKFEKTSSLMLVSSSLYFILSTLLLLLAIDHLLISEIVPEHQFAFQKPQIGDKIEVYGVWVMDHHRILFPDWYEIHPVNYMKNLRTGFESNNLSKELELMEGVENPSRLLILDKESPYRFARGTVVDFFENPEDGDWHIHIMPDPEFRDLIKTKGSVPYLPVSNLLLSILLFALCLILFVFNIR